MNKPCQACIRRKKIDPKHKVRVANQKHHRFSNTVPNRALYPDYINNPKNLEDACSGCNASHASPFLTHWDEKTFCGVMGIKPRSKIATRAKNE